MSLVVGRTAMSTFIFPAYLIPSAMSSALALPGPQPTSKSPAPTVLIGRILVMGLLPKILPP